MRSQETVGRRAQRTPSESTRRLLERRRRRAKKGGGRDGGNGLLAVVFRGVSIVVVCMLLLLLCMVFGLVLQNYRVDPDSSHPLAPRAAGDNASSINRIKRLPDAKARRRKREPVDDEKPGNGDSSAVNIAVPNAEWVPLDEKMSSGGEPPERQAVGTVAAERETKSEQVSVSAKAVRDRNHGEQTPVRKIQRPGDLEANRGAGIVTVAGGGKGIGSSVYHDPADGVFLTSRGSAGGDGSAVGPMERFLKNGGKLPILLLTCNRAALLQKTIESLRGVRGVDISQVLVLQDGTDQGVKAVVEEEGLYLEQNSRRPSLRGSDGAARIATHYKYALDHTFQKFPEAPGVIIVEDDLLFSPDFLEYFEYNAPILEQDPTTLVLSAWNDNGYKGLVSDKAELQRTMFFPGLGWLMTKELYQGELRQKWPNSHWDHWLRDPKQHNWRECVYPEVPRTYHNGVKGTFMDQRTHDRLFKNIDYNTDAAFSWAQVAVANIKGDGVAVPTYARGMRDNYEQRVRARISEARHINDLDVLSNMPGSQEDVVFWYDMPKVDQDQGRGRPPFQALADYFGIWHEYKRAEHLGMHILRRGGGEHDPHVMLINTAKSPYAGLMPPDMSPAQAGQLRRGGLGDKAAAKIKANLRVLAGTTYDASCDSICAAQGMKCEEALFGYINSCAMLREHFSCGECAVSLGPDQPCYVSPDAPVAKYPGKCLTTETPLDSQCSASHPLTRRLCPCSLKR